ncbi:hypothetical protein QOZ80_9AG0676010 [Eleusine coracana subsp. coracana]|nr:hypothetical protein QOZ80_9AG0676010 [Eleusine coracana subsp. coracana]
MLEGVSVGEHQQTMPTVPEHNPPAEAIRVVDTALVCPLFPGRRSSSWSAPPVQRVLFYCLDAGTDVDAIISILRDSLSHALRVFYPLSGRLRLSPGTANRYELHYRPDDAVAFTIAEYNDSHDRRQQPRRRRATGGFEARPASAAAPGRRRRARVAGHGRQVRRPGAGRTGTQPPPVPPVIEGTLICDPTGLYDVFCPTVNDASKFVKPSSTAADDKLLFATFVLSRAHLQRVKDVVAATRGVAPALRCSSLVATLGLIWSCFQRATNNKPDGRACLLFSVDHRPRMNPPLPEKFLGNCVGAAVAFASGSELAEPGATGLSATCAAAITDATSGSVTEVAPGMSVLSVAGSPRFRVYELDFRFGRPVKVDVVSVARTGAVAVAESRVGDGGMEVGLALPPDGMDAFWKCFADAVAGLDMRVAADRARELGAGWCISNRHYSGI